MVKKTGLEKEKTVTITVPAGVYEFCSKLTALDGGNLEDFLQEEIIRVADAVIDELPSQWIDKEALKKKYKIGDCDQQKEVNT